MPKLIVEVNLDMVPGRFHQIEDFVEHFLSDNCGIPHYIKSVTVMEEPQPRGEAFHPPHLSDVDKFVLNEEKEDRIELS